MDGFKAFSLKKRFYLLISECILVFCSFLPCAIAADQSTSIEGIFPLHTQSDRIITEEMLDTIITVCDKFLPRKVENQLFNVKSGGYYAEKGIFVPTKIKDPNILKAFNEVLKPGIRFLDLGSGDGRVVFLATLFGAISTGIEFDGDIFKSSIKAREKLSQGFDLSETKLMRGDFFNADFSRFDSIYYFMGGSFEEGRLEEKLAREMEPGAILIGYIEHKAFRKLSSVGQIGKRVSIYVKR
ncbi:MAG: hypothetical protein SVY10_04170 [Thermodesulfobacteriota bacterium]|nr:hypothetical protein [Thermodesulfobacteriota bacterium]